MLPELDDLKERRLFSDAEVKEIARRRREFEFRLERRSKMKEDYLSYIEYELQVEKLRLLRKKSLVRELHSFRRRWQPSLCDRASAMRIMLIYQRAVTRFKGDLDLWMQYLEYCKCRGTRRMQKVLTKVLRLHPTVPGIWIYASAWEFEQNANIVAARSLMQRGLRMCSQSEQLWVEYFQMELVYVERLKANTFAPVTEKNNPKTELDGDHDEDANLYLHVDGGNKDESEEFNKLCRGTKAIIDCSNLDELAYKLTCTIYKNAILALPANASLRRTFIELLQKAQFTGASFLREKIFTSLERDFLLDSGCWDWQARFRFGVTGDTEIAIKVYERALGVVSSADMYKLYSQFLREISGLEGQNVKLTCVTPTQMKEGRVFVATKLLGLYSRAKEAGMLSSDLAEGYANLLLKLGKLDVAKQLLEEFCIGQFRNCTRLWAMRVGLEMKSEVVAEVCSMRIADLFEQSLKHVSSAEAGELWSLVCEKGYESLSLDTGEKGYESFFGYRMDGNKKEGFSSEDRQPIPTAHEIGESSGQAEEALQVVTAVTMFKQLMENPRSDGTALAEKSRSDGRDANLTVLLRLKNADMMDEKNGDMMQVKCLPKGKWTCKCNFCGRSWDGGPLRIRAHILGIAGHGVGGPCEEAPAYVVEIVTRLHADARPEGDDTAAFVDALVNDLEGDASQAQESASMNTHAKGTTNVSGSSKSNVGFSSKKRKVPQGGLTSAFDLQARKQANQALCRFFYAEDVPTWKVRSPYFLQMVKAIGQAGPSYVPPSYHALRTTKLNEEVKCVKIEIMGDEDNEEEDKEEQFGAQDFADNDEKATLEIVIDHDVEVLEYCGGQVLIYDRIVDITLNKMASSVADPTSALLACSLVDWIFCSQDIKHARSVYSRILALPNTSMLVYKHCINVECQMAAQGCKDAPICVRRLFECALSKHSQSAELWLDYCSLEIKAGNLDAAGNIYWRAKKILHDTSAFIEGHERLRAREEN
ncbi:hypothetical protein L7F22_047998 [Adiantum nelumboides]|nr:hypothetical protein [Adiantum nelumboides]